ncbi:class I SAM-dependent methyltransferase [Paracoccus sp. J55]|uniref:class I SAM-dependent methyltransferase n=1 Tax=Paracoccus sp. J55 TaxID=935849 RepID=UPI0004BC307A|nr:class I SAM-dependent methyltransferase [Paracoccus sp. J55]
MDQSHKEGEPAPTPVAAPAGAGESRFAVTYLRENSPTWDRARFRAVLGGEIEPETQAEIGRRRTALRNYAPSPLHRSYGGKSHAGREGPGLVTSDILAISPAYGAVLYNLARSIEAGLILEAGAGFGISSMYLAAAARRAEGGTLLSFEISDYAAIAQASVNLIDPGSRVVQGDFACFPSYLAGAAEVDLAFIDAVHEKDAMLRSFRSLIGWMARRSMIIVDDLSYSESSREAFRCMMRMEHHDFVCIVNRRFGVLIKG